MNADAAPRVVIIDDTADLRELLHMALERGGYDVVAEAGDGSSGIEAVRLHRPELVLLDLAMPAMDGIEALPSIRRLVPEASIVVLSGFGAQQMSARAVTAGADGYVQKGAPLKTIISYIDGVTADAGRTAPRGARALSVVPADAPPSAPTSSPPSDVLEKESPTSSPTMRAIAPMRGPAEVVPDHVSAAAALQLAPYGVVELADEPLFRLVHTNATAARLIGSDQVGVPLAVIAPELASLVSYYRLDSDAAFEVELHGKRIRATLRRTGWSVLVFLDSATEDVGLLRRAIATTAHEVRGPVAVLCGIAETLVWDGNKMSPEQNSKLMTAVARQARILDRITADLLTAAQIQRGTLRVDLQAVDPAVVIRSVIEERYDVELIVDDERQVRADPLRLEQMLTNLLSNAHKYGAAPFVVRLRAADENLDEGGSLCIDVVDHGPGVPPEFSGHLFREFARAHDAVASGTGLGLYVVRTLARAQDGEVTFAPGDPTGSVFTITLPAL